MRCERCGNVIGEGQMFCGGCGAPVNSRTAENYSRDSNDREWNGSYGYPVEQRTSGYAIASLVLGIVGLFAAGLICGIIAICLGVKAKNDRSKDPVHIKGSSMATAGIVLGIIDIVVAVVAGIAVGFSLFAFL